MSHITSWTKARRAQENRAYVRGLLRQREPAFAAALAAAERDFVCPACSRASESISTRRAHAVQSCLLGHFPAGVGVTG